MAILGLSVVILGILAAIFVSPCSAEAKMLIFPMVFEGFWLMELLPRSYLWWLQRPFWRFRGGESSLTSTKNQMELLPTILDTLAAILSFLTCKVRFVR